MSAVMKGLLFAGNVLIDRQNPDGTWAGFQGPLNVTKLELKAEVEKKSRTSKKADSYGQSLGTAYLPKPFGLTIEMDDQPADVLAMALLGDVSDINEGSGNVTDQLLTLPAGYKWVDIGKPNLAAAGLGVKLADDTVVNLADVEINYASGLIRAKPGGALGNAETPIKFTYQHNAITGKRISAGTNSIIKTRMKLDGKNLEDGSDIRGEIPLATLAPSAGLDLFSSDFVTTVLQGEANLAQGYNSPFVLDMPE